MSKKHKVFTSYTCLICGDGMKYTCQGFTNHLKVHDISKIDYVNQFVFRECYPTCKCGCGIKLPIVDYRYNDFISGHNPRIVTDELREKLSSSLKRILSNEDEKNKRRSKMIATKQKQSEQGLLKERHWSKTHDPSWVAEKQKAIGQKSSITKKMKQTKVWNDGLTSSTDERVAKYSGSNNYRYNGNDYNVERQKYTKLFRNKEYRNLILEQQQNVCFVCNIEHNSMCLHHVDEDKCNDSWDNLIFVCRSCHIKVHSVSELSTTLQQNVKKFKKEIHGIFE